MGRIFTGLTVIFFGIGSVSGLVLIGFALVEGDFRTLGGVALGTLLFAWITFANWRDWQRLQQARAEQKLWRNPPPP